MKHLILSLILGFLATSCGRSEDPPANPVAQLPPATQTGANTIGCLVNGEVFLPHQNNPTGPASKSCNYEFLDNGYHLSINFSNDTQEYLKSVSVRTHNIDLLQGSIYQLEIDNGYSGITKYGEFTKYTGGINGIKRYKTNSVFVGQLKIDRLDKINHIISGTFWFDGELNGEIIKVTEGRFDMQYTP